MLSFEQRSSLRPLAWSFSARPRPKHPQPTSIDTLVRFTQTQSHSMGLVTPCPYETLLTLVV
ncbi:hypothetical protein BCR37DRAFT_376936 [Protomyces lactucae-debilis]|uniref:Uncharacterized protein n=1 Tax=Protomyces lactucae-debilis TaxID=2754530 RepID=A0A1Y2FQV7_PROLT|nr:uncharacterized protein BCR37DRAFT_376936 [Protomyces lactucae-debilis]ORY86358.1 hypothetical protein BCR37DRAFT_376936 [Protomyces lactucae-debilis]